MRIVKKALSSLAVEFIRETLAQGVTLLTLLNKLDLENGTVWTYVPDNLDEEQLYDFKEAIAITAELELNSSNQVNNISYQKIAGQMEDATTDYIKRFLEASKNNLGIFENTFFSASAPFLEKSVKTAPYLFYGGDIYTYVTNNNSSKEAVNNAIALSNSYLLTGILTSTPDINELQPFAKITLSQLELFVSNLSAIIMTAYDGDGFVIWEKK